MKDEKNDIEKDLITRYLAGEATAEEELQLRAWIDKTPENEQEYLATKTLFELSQRHYAAKRSETLDIDIDHEWNHFMKNIQQGAPVRKLETARTTSTFWYKIAASILVLAVCGYVVNRFLTRAEEVVMASAHDTKTVSLPDGSQVILNKHSRIAYTTDFGKKDRNITLTGEAFFDVTPDASKPFVISANGATIEVLGTSFNVRAYDKQKAIEVVVETGVVKLSSSDKSSEIKLTAGEKGIYTKSDKKISSGVNDDANFLSWNTRKIVFVEEDLKTVVETLSKIYQIEIIITGNIPDACEVTASFDQQTIGSVLHVLSRTLNVNYEIKENHIEITSAGC